LDASDLREWIAVFQMELTPDGQGGYLETVPAGLVADLPANVATPRGPTIWSADQLGDRVRLEFTIRYEPGISSVYRVLYRNQLLDIVGEPENIDSLDTWLKIVCERREAGKQ
jgi:head-tail adaptor